MAHRDSIIRKVKSLLAMTTENGASENEALLAAKKAAELMADYDISLSETSVREDRYGKSTEKTGQKQLHPVQFTLTSIAKFTHCKVWIAHHRMAETEINWFGTYDNVSIAKHLKQLFQDAMDREYERYYASVKDNGYRQHGKTLRKNFMLGMAHRLNKRLNELTKEKEAKVEKATGNALIVLQQQMTEEKFRTLGINLRSTKVAGTRGDSGAYAAGHEAGGKVNLSSGAIGQPRKRIGNG